MTIPRLSWPPTMTFDQAGRGSLQSLEQDSPEEIQQGVMLFCELRVDDLPWAPDLGIPDPLASIDPERTAGEIEQAILDFEPRASYRVAIDTVDDRRQIHLKAS